MEAKEKKWWNGLTEIERRKFVQDYFKNCNSEKVDTLTGLMEEEIKEIYFENFNIITKRMDLLKKFDLEIGDVILIEKNEIKTALIVAFPLRTKLPILVYLTHNNSIIENDKIEGFLNNLPTDWKKRKIVQNGFSF